jgi:hypothetical protein
LRVLKREKFQDGIAAEPTLGPEVVECIKKL